MAGIRLFTLELTDPSGTSLTLEGGRDFEDADHPFYIADATTTWAMRLDEACGLAGAAQRIAHRLSWALEKGERPDAGPFFRRKLFDDKTFIVELGLAVIGECDTVYFQFGARRVHISIERGDHLLYELGRFADEASTIRRASRPEYEDPAHGWPLLGLRQVWRR